MSGPPSPLSDVFGSFRPPPATHVCTACGQAAYHPGRCGDCADAERKEHQRVAHRAIAVEKTELSIPPRFAWARLDAPELAGRVHDTKAVARVRGALNVARVITLLGPAGAGKSSLAVAALRAWSTEHGIAGVYVDAADLATARARGKLGAGDPEVVESAMGMPVAVIDEVGRVKPTAWCATADVVHKRHLADARTIYVSGLTREQLAERYDDGVLRRMLESAAVIDVARR